MASSPYDITSFAPHSLSSDDHYMDLWLQAHMISPASLLALAPRSPLLPLSSDDHYMGLWLQAHMISPDLLLTFAPDCLSSSSQPLLTSIGVNGYKPQYYHQLFAFLWPSSDDHYTSLWLQAVYSIASTRIYISFCWILLEKGTASVHPHITLFASRYSLL